MLSARALAFGQASEVAGYALASRAAAFRLAAFVMQRVSMSVAAKRAGSAIVALTISHLATRFDEQVVNSEQGMTFDIDRLTRDLGWIECLTNSPLEAVVGA